MCRDGSIAAFRRIMGGKIPADYVKGQLHFDQMPWRQVLMIGSRHRDKSVRACTAANLTLSFRELQHGPMQIV